MASPHEASYIRPPGNFALAADARTNHIRILIALACLAILRLWFLPLGSSFWLDETGTFWSAYKGIVPAIDRSQVWPGQNTIYTMLAAAVIRLGGSSEAALRLPSVLAAVLTAWLLFRLGEHFFDREAGVLAVVVLASLHEIARDAATNARPYGIALLLVVASVLQLVRWFETRRRRNMVGFVITVAAIPYFHYLFTTIYLVLLAYAIYIWRSSRRIPLKHLIAAGALIAILLSPLAWNVLYVRRVSSESSWASTPDVQALVSSFMPQVLAASLFLGAVVGFIACGTAKIVETPRSPRFLLVTWLAIPIITLFIVARVSPFKVFVFRYYLPALPALALLVGCGIRSLSPPRMRMIISIFVVVISIMSYSGYHWTLSARREDWRRAAESVRAAGISATTPVLIRTGLVETAKVHWDLNIDRDSPLLCPLSKYPIPGRIILLPSRLDSENIRYLEQVTSHILNPADRFVLLARNDEDNVAWMRGWFLGQGFEESELGSSPGVRLFLFRNSNRTPR
jgi:4-amino-4-deoxy-L-arabinose transferase-like glycosyltransferase